MERLEREMRLGRVDRDIQGLLERINSMETFYTTSSCSGRMVVIWSSSPRDKRSATVLGKWHSKPAFNEFARAIARAVDMCRRDGGYAWASYHPLALDIACSDYENASGLVSLLVNGGFKYACMRKSKHGFMILVRVGTKVDMPVCVEGVDLSSCEGYVIGLYKVLTRYMDESKRWLERLYNLFTLGHSTRSGDEEVTLGGGL